MKDRIGRALVVALMASPILAPPGVEARQNPSHTHVAHVLDAFPAAPEGRGLLATAEAEAAVAAQHARLAANDDTNLDWMKTHARHVLHAVDPSRVEGGPGLGFGVQRASEAVAQHIALAAGAEGASSNLRTHAEHVAAAATAVAQRAVRIADLAERVDRAADYTAAADLIGQILALSDQLVTGFDADGNGQVSWQAEEGGLEQVRQHMNLLAQGEGLE